MEQTHSMVSTYVWTFCQMGPWPHFYQSELSNRRIEKSCIWGAHRDAVVIYQNIPVAQHTQWELNKHPDKLQMVAKSYAEKYFN